MDRKVSLLADEWEIPEETLQFVLSRYPSLAERVEALPDESVDLDSLHTDCKSAAVGQPPSKR